MKESKHEPLRAVPASINGAISYWVGAGASLGILVIGNLTYTSLKKESVADSQTLGPLPSMWNCLRQWGARYRAGDVRNGAEREHQ